MAEEGIADQAGGGRESGPVIYRVLGWFVTVLTPVVLVLTAVRLIFSPLFLRLEYNLPGFPPDPYGFTTEQRIHWAGVAKDYLLNSADISFLSDLRFSDGSPLYNERELKHMVDVKSTVKAALSVWYISLAVLAGLGIWAWFGKWWHAYRRGLGRGGWLTVFLIGGIIVIVLISFGVFFVAFHNVFFDPGTWTFSFSDTLIRLFPERFWRDIFLAVGLLSLGGGLALGWLFRGK